MDQKLCNKRLFLSFLTLTCVGLGEFAKLMQTISTLEGLRNLHDSTNTPRAYCVKKHVYGPGKASVRSALLQSACVKFPSELSKIAGQRFFFFSKNSSK